MAGHSATIMPVSSRSSVTTSFIFMPSCIYHSPRVTAAQGNGRRHAYGLDRTVRAMII
jgi:hypothetical protein